MSTAVAVKFAGASGKAYDFEAYPWNSTWNSVAVVYVVLRQEGTRLQVLYVGETSDLKQRMANHHRQACFDRHGKTHLAVVMETSPNRRTAIETDLMNSYSPPCNREL